MNVSLCFFSIIPQAILKLKKSEQKKTIFHASRKGIFRFIFFERFYDAAVESWEKTLPCIFRGEMT